MLIVSSKVKHAIAAQDLRCSSDALEAINNAVETILKRAGNIAKADGVKTIKADHINAACPWGAPAGS